MGKQQHYILASIRNGTISIGVTDHRAISDASWCRKSIWSMGFTKK